MKLTKTLIALAAVAAGSATIAAPNPNRIAIQSGASASKGNVAIGLNASCVAAGGVMTEFANGGNISTYVCANGAVTAASYGTNADNTFRNFANTAFAEVRLNVNGGAFSATCLLKRLSATEWRPGACATINGLVGGVGPNGIADRYNNPATGALQFFADTGVAATSNVVVGGFMDVEPESWPASVTLGLFPLPSVTDSGFAQTFGVAVSNDLYVAMFNDQKAAGKLPGTCVVTNYNLPYCVPSIGKPQMATILNDNQFGSITGSGAQFLVPSLPAPAVLTYARRIDTSGTQAAAQNYFMGTACNPVSALQVVAGGQTLGNLVVQNNSTTGGVRTALGAAGYVIGIMSGENNQTGQTWKWLRVAGVPMADSALPADPAVASITNTKTAIDGTYDYWFNTQIASSGAPGADAYFTELSTRLAVVPVGTTKGLFILPTETAYTKAAVACQNPASN